MISLGTFGPAHRPMNFPTDHIEARAFSTAAFVSRDGARAATD